MSQSALYLALRERDEYTAQEIRDIIKDMRAAVKDGEDPEEVLYEFGLEPDYIFDIL